MGLEDIRPKSFLFDPSEPTGYKLCYDLNALAIIEEESGENIFKILKKFEGEEAGKAAENLSFKDIRTLLYAGIKSEHPDMTIQEAGRLAGISGIEKVIETIVRAFGLSLPNSEKKKK